LELLKAEGFGIEELKMTPVFQRIAQALDRQKKRLFRNSSRSDDQSASRRAEIAEFAGVCFNYGNLLAENGRLDEALAYYRRSEVLGNSAWILHHYHGNVLDRDGQFDAAMQQWEKAVTGDYPEILSVYSDIIMRLIHHGDRLAAERWLKQVTPLYCASVEQAAKRGDFRRFLLADFRAGIQKCLDAVCGILSSRIGQPRVRGYPGEGESISEGE